MTSPPNTGRQQRFGPWAVVTGASDGIGRAFAWELARTGTHVVLVARREGLLHELATQLQQECGVETRVIAADVADRAGVATVLRACSDLDIGLLVAAAGFGTSGPFVRQALDDELAMIDVNCRAVAELSHHFAIRFQQQQRGGIVLLSSILAFAGVPLSANYAATKAYVQSLAEGLHLECAPFGVSVLAVAAGPTATGFAERAQLRMSTATSPIVVARESLSSLGRMTTVRPGLLTKLLDGSLRLVPRLVRSRILGKVMQGMTAHQRNSS